MRFTGAIVREQGITFGIALVTQSAMQNADSTRRSFQSEVDDFRLIPLVLACQDHRGAFSYQGRRDIVDFLASIDPSRIPWMDYTI